MRIQKQRDVFVGIQIRGSEAADYRRGNAKRVFDQLGVPQNLPAERRIDG